MRARVVDLCERGQRRPAFEARIFRVGVDRVEVVEVPQRVVAPTVGLGPDVDHVFPRNVLLAGLETEANRMFCHARYLTPAPAGDNDSGSPVSGSRRTATEPRSVYEEPDPRVAPPVLRREHLSNPSVTFVAGRRHGAHRHDLRHHAPARPRVSRAAEGRTPWSARPLRSMAFRARRRRSRRATRAPCRPRRRFAAPRPRPTRAPPT